MIPLRNLLLVAVALSSLLGGGCLQYQKAPLDTSGFTNVYDFVTVQDRTLHVATLGKGEPVVFLHGFASYLHIWTATATLLGDSVQSILFDLPGFGLSDKEEDSYTPSRIAELVHDALVQMGHDKVTLVGHSWGCSVVLAFTLKYPEMVERIVVVDGWMYPEQRYGFIEWSKVPVIGELLVGIFYDEQTEYRYQSGFYDPDPFMSVEVIESVEKHFALPGVKAASLATMRGMDEMAVLAPLYGTIDAPTTVVWCKEDPVADLPFGQKLAATIPGAELVTLDQCGHFPMIEQPSAFVSILEGVLQ